MSGLSVSQKEKFSADGYLIVEDMIDVEDYLDPMVAEYEARIDVLAHDLHAAGRIPSLYSDLDFRPRLTRIYEDTGRDWAQYFDFSLPLRPDIGTDEPCFFPPSVLRLLRHPGVLDAVESLIGPEIYCNPVQHVRLKPPERLLPILNLDALKGMVGATDWHQDASVVIEEADATEIITVWTPVFDSTVENGCLAIVPRNHTSGLFEHCPAPTGKYLSEKLFDADRKMPVPMKRGSVLFMTRMTPHCSVPNKSGEMRWSMDLRYNKTGMPTGRPEFPGFVARSRSNPGSELTDPVAWEASWLTARERIATKQDQIARFARNWSGAGCA